MDSEDTTGQDAAEAGDDFFGALPGLCIGQVGYHKSDCDH